MTEIELRPASAADLEAVTGLLERCQLPVGGLEDQFGEGYVIALDGGGVVGTAGMELYGADGLLRSVAVDPAYRGRGLGERLTRERLHWARAQRLETVYLLTTDAGGWFPRLGFAPLARERVAEAVRASPQFADICPSSATVMALTLDGAACATR